MFLSFRGNEIFAELHATDCCYYAVNKILLVLQGYNESMPGEASNIIGINGKATAVPYIMERE